MKKAYTFIELLISIAIIMIFAGIALPAYNNYTNQQRLRSDTQKIVDSLELAKKKAYSSDLYDTTCTNFNGYRITLNASSYILKFGCNGTYQTVQTYNMETTSDSVILGTGDFTFYPQGLNNNITTSTIRVKNSILNQCLTITVSKIGIIDINSTFTSC